MEADREKFTSLTLLGRLAAGIVDERAWDDFFDRYGPHILRWCRKRGGADTDLDDVVQEVSMKLFRELPKFRYKPGGSFRGWLKTVTDRVAIDALRSANKRKFVEESEMDEALASRAKDEFFEAMHRAHHRELVRVALDELRSEQDEGHIRVFEMMAFEGRAPGEVAEILGLNENTVSQRASRIRRALKKKVVDIESQF